MLGALRSLALTLCLRDPARWLARALPRDAWWTGAGGAPTSELCPSRFCPAPRSSTRREQA
eukprot:13290793-Alexandrium_andersonii.AAC.1